MLDFEEIEYSKAEGMYNARRSGPQEGRKKEAPISWGYDVDDTAPKRAERPVGVRTNER